MRTALRVLLNTLLILAARIRGRALALEGPRGRYWLYPDGTVLPVIAGADGDDEDDAQDEETDADDEAPDESEDDDEKAPEFSGDFDADRAKRLIANERERSKKRLDKAQKAKEAAEKRARELEQAQETEHETTKRQLGEAQAEAATQKANADRIRIDVAIRDAGAEAEVQPKRLKRLVRLVDRDGLTVTDDGEVEGVEQAVAEVLEDFPEFKAQPKPEDPEPEEDEKPEEGRGGAPDRKRKASKELTAAQAKNMAKTEPDRFNELYEAGKIPASALAGK